MAEMLDESEVDWLEGLEEELIMQDLLFGAEQLPLEAPQLTAAESEPEVRSEALVNMLVSKVYSGPTIGDIESALNLSCSNDKHGGGGRHFRSGLPEKGSGSRTDNKHALRIKTIVNGVADDGYKWRKYGQKLIKNSQNPSRSYYRCTNPRCNAKKQVERSTEDPETVIVTYEGLHLHYTYSHLLLSQKRDKHAATLNAAKKPRIEPELQDRGSERSLQKRERPQQKKSLRAGESHREYLEDIVVENASAREKSIQNRSLADVQRRQGMLEDVVPLMVRKPSNEPHYSSQDSSPSHYSSLFLSPSSSQIDAGILSGIL